jgi:hypothetical protein
MDGNLPVSDYCALADGVAAFMNVHCVRLPWYSRIWNFRLITRMELLAHPIRVAISLMLTSVFARRVLIRSTSSTEKQFPLPLPMYASFYRQFEVPAP